MEKFGPLKSSLKSPVINQEWICRTGKDYYRTFQRTNIFYLNRAPEDDARPAARVKDDE